MVWKEKGDKPEEEYGMRCQKMVFTSSALLLIAVLGYAFCLLSCKPQGDQRKLTLSDFDFLEVGMSLEEITERVGEPDRDVGSGIFLIQYDLADGRTLQLVFISPDELIGVQLRERDGTWIELLGEDQISDTPAAP